MIIRLRAFININIGRRAAAKMFKGRASLRAARALVPGAATRVAVWSLRDAPGFAAECQRKGLPVIRVEDGFLRSVGLGSDLLSPGSLVIDDAHLYFDSRGASRLETILQTTVFDPALLARANGLIGRIKADSFTKYNLGGAAIDLRALAGGRPIAAVVEQVPGDAALAFSQNAAGSNLDLLKAARAARPGAYLVYKEHPDLVSGNRRGRLPRQSTIGLADLVISSGDLGALYGQIDELHVISSLAGFEALIRGVPVQTWGVPFYGGWGLTHDMVTTPRRTRAVTLPELITAVLILYPLYADPVTSIPCSVEDFLDSIAALRRGTGLPARRGGLARAWRFLKSLDPRTTR